MKLRNVTEMVVVHHSLTDTGNVEVFRIHHKKPKEQGGLGAEDIGYHFLIQPCGDLELGRPERFIGAHARGKNFNSIGVVFVGNFFKYEPTFESLNTFHNLYNSLCKTYQKKLIIGFHRREGLKNSCPGPKLNRIDFLEIMYKGVINGT